MVDIIEAANHLTWPGAIAVAAFCGSCAWVAVGFFKHFFGMVR